MIHFFPDGDGGFFGYDDPVLDFQGDLILILIAAICITAIVVPFGTNPELFADGIACALIGIVLVLLSSGKGGLPFLRPLALPLFVYFLASSSFSLEAISGEFGLLMWPILGIYLIFAGLGLYSLVLGGEELDGVIALFTLGFGAPIWFTSITAGMDDYQGWLHGTFMFYLLRVALVIGLVWAVVVLVMWVIALFKGNVSFKAIGLRLALIALGIVPVFAAGIVSRMIPGGTASLIGLAALFAIFAAAGVAAHIIAERIGEDADLVSVVVILVVAGAAGFMSYASFKSDAEVLVMLRPFANASFLVNEMFAASTLAAQALAAIFNGAIWVFTRIFDLSMVTVDVPMHIGFFVLVVVAVIAVAAGEGIAQSRLAKKS